MTHKLSRLWLYVICSVAAGLTASCTSLAMGGEKISTIPASQQPMSTQEVVLSLSPILHDNDLIVVPPPLNQPLDLIYAHTASKMYTPDIYGYTVAANDSFQITQTADTGAKTVLYPEAWSPDGKSIIIMLSQSYGPDENPCEPHPKVASECMVAYLIDATNLSAKPLFDFEQIDFAYMGQAIYWSPDSKSFTYAGVDPQTRRGYLAVYDLDTSTSRYLAQSPEQSFVQFRPLGWSSNGKEVFYISGADRIMDQSLPRYNQIVVYKIAIDTLETTEVYNPNATVGWIDISPTNSNQLATWSTSPDWTAYTQVFTLTFIDLSSDKRTELSVQDLNNGFHFSPNGEFLVFTRGGKEPHELCFLSVDSDEISCAQDDYFKSASVVGLGSWLPDSQSIVVYRTSNPYDPDTYRLDIVLVRPDGSRGETLASACSYTSDNPACSLSRIVWNPNYRRP